MEKENDQYTFYFYLQIYNFNKNYIEYKYLVFRPQSVGKNVPIKGMWSNLVGKKVPTYGTLVVENIKDGLFYLNIENLEKGDTIYLQFIVNSQDILRLIIYLVMRITMKCLINVNIVKMLMIKKKMMEQQHFMPQ